MHEHVHDQFSMEKRGDIILSRGMPIHSADLGITGVCDMVELHASPDGVKIRNYEGTWRPVPIEYKRGTPKENDADRLQLCCQAMCLEEMLVCEIEEAYLYYGETGHRTKVLLEESLREKVKEMLLEMHEYYQRRYTPRVKPSNSCQACSLKDLCLPRLYKKYSASEYVNSRLSEELS